MAPHEDLAERLLTRSSIELLTGCRRWNGAHTPKGYGQISVGAKRRAVHRVAYEIWVGPIPDGYEIDHVYDRGCRHRDCINSDHLEADPVVPAALTSGAHS